MSLYSFFHVFHLVFLFLLAGVTFAAFAAPTSENRRPYLIQSGVYSLLVFITGFGLLGVIKAGFPLWIIVKLVCWLVLSALAGLAFRRTGAVRAFYITAIAAIVLAIIMVEFKPLA